MKVSTVILRTSDLDRAVEFWSGRGIRVLPGDTVDVEVSTYDPTRGRIVWRYR